MAERAGYSDWRSLEQAIKDAAKNAAGQAGPGISAAGVGARVRQARFDRFLCRVFAEGEQSEWLLKGGLSMLARIPRSRTTKDVEAMAAFSWDAVYASAAGLTANAEQIPMSESSLARWDCASVLWLRPAFASPAAEMLPRLLGQLAARSGQVLNITAVAAALSAQPWVRHPPLSNH